MTSKWAIDLGVDHQPVRCSSFFVRFVLRASCFFSTVFVFLKARNKIVFLCMKPPYPGHIMQSCSGSTRKKRTWLANQRKITWIYPRPSNNGKWSFIGIPYKKMSSWWWPLLGGGVRSKRKHMYKFYFSTVLWFLFSSLSASWRRWYSN